MRNWGAVLVLFVCGVMASAQNYPRVEVFGGYSLLHIDTQGVSGSSLDALVGAPPGTFKVQPNMNGWNGGVQVNLTNWFGVKGDIGGNYGTPLTVSSQAQAIINGLGITGFPPKATSYNFLFGPVGYKQIGRWTPFGHALFGANRITTGAINIPVSAGLLPAVGSFSETDTAFGMALGGGVDWRLTKQFSVRLGEADYLYTGHDFSFGVPGVSKHQNNLRVSAGIVYSFGGRSTVTTGSTSVSGGRPNPAATSRATMSIAVLGIVVSPPEGNEGAEIVGIDPGSIAALAILHVGDLIRSVDGKPVRTPMELAAELANRPQGSQVRLGYLYHTSALGFISKETVVILGSNR